jgi:DNA-binding transcriptional MerR regulator
MAAAAAAGGAAASPTRSLLSIGQVLSKLSAEFPGLTSSKLRFLEVQGIVSPQRTSSGYRKFSAADVERLRLALTLRRDHYLPLGVIRDHLDDVEAGREPSLPAAPESIHPQERSYSRAELLAETSAPARLLDEAQALGLVRADEGYGTMHVALLRALVALEKYGIDPRHVRSLKQGAQRDVALIETALAPLLRRSDASARAQASEVGPRLVDRLDEVRGIFVRQALGQILPD